MNTAHETGTMQLQRDTYRLPNVLGKIDGEHLPSLVLLIAFKAINDDWYYRKNKSNWYELSASKVPYILTAMAAQQDIHTGTISAEECGGGVVLDVFKRVSAPFMKDCEVIIYTVDFNIGVIEVTYRKLLLEVDGTPCLAVDINNVRYDVFLKRLKNIIGDTLFPKPKHNLQFTAKDNDAFVNYPIPANGIAVRKPDCLVDWDIIEDTKSSLMNYLRFEIATGSIINHGYTDDSNIHCIPLANKVIQVFVDNRHVFDVNKVPSFFRNKLK